MVLERDAEVAALATAATRAASGHGTIVLVSGEAGIGKSTLVSQLPPLLPPEGRILTGWCDDLATPRVLGPLRDLEQVVGQRLRAALGAGDRSPVLDALRDELTTGARPTVLVLEDLHWADEATLDVLAYLTRRIATLPAIVVLTYRDDEVPADHPLHRLLGLAARVAPVIRLHPARLSLTAVRTLSAAAGLDADRLFGITSGNPYFVTEVIASGEGEGVPLTIADAVQARLSRLAHAEPAAVDAVTRLAVVPSAVEPWLVEAVVSAGLSAVADAERSGLLVMAENRVTFRHELTRRAVLHSMPAAQRITAERAVLAALLSRPALNLSRIVHHARGALDRDAMLRYGPLAAREAIAAGAHRQAVEHLRLVLDLAPRLSPEDEADLWESLAVESYTVDAPFAEAVAAQRRAVELRTGGDTNALGTSLRWLSRISWWAGDPEGAGSAAEQARAVLEGVGDPDLLAMAISNQAQLHALAGRDHAATELAEQGLAMPGLSPATRSHLLNNLGLAGLRIRQPGALAALRESLAVALAADEPEHACRAYVNLVWHELEILDFAAAESDVRNGFALAERTEFLTFARYLQLILGMLHFATGHWDEVLPAAAFAADGSPPIRCAALTLIGRLGARRGEAGHLDQLREVWGIAEATGECQRIGPAAIALGEAAVLAGEPELAAAEVHTAYDLAQEHGTPAVRAELGYWRRRLTPAVALDDADDLGAEPYWLLTRGRWHDAEAVWTRAGSRFEAALARSHSPATDDLLSALAVFDAMGARAWARSVRASLRLRGATGVPRGPLPATRHNPAGLTTRQWEVAQLLIHGMTNPEIARHLVVSVRTVDTHVAAILAKVGALNRRELLARATDFGLA